MQTINPISDPDEIRQARDAPEPSATTATSDQSVVNAVSEQQSAQGFADQPAAQPIEQTVAVPTPIATNPFTADYQMPAANKDMSGIYPDPDKIKADKGAAGAATFAPVDGAAYTYDKPFGVMLISVVAGTVAALYIYLLFVAGLSSFGSWLQVVLVALCAVVAVGLWRRSYIIYWLAIVLAGILALWHGYSFIHQFIGIDWTILTAMANSGFGRLIVAGLILQSAFVIVPAYIVYYLLRPKVAQAFSNTK